MRRNTSDRNARAIQTDRHYEPDYFGICSISSHSCAAHQPWLVLWHWLCNAPNVAKGHNRFFTVLNEFYIVCGIVNLRFLGVEFKTECPSWGHVAALRFDPLYLGSALPKHGALTRSQLLLPSQVVCSLAGLRVDLCEEVGLGCDVTSIECMKKGDSN